MPPNSSNKLITLSIVLLVAVLAAAWLKKSVIDSSLPPKTATSAKVDTSAPIETNNANQLTTSDNTAVPLDQSADSTMPATSTPSDEEVDIDALIRKHLSVEMIQEINEKLRPTNKPPQVVQNAQGSYVDLSDRSSTVSIAVIDENGETIVFDITSPINLEPESP